MTGPLRYILADPTGNMTLLVETPVPPAEQPAAAARLMAEVPEAEQAAFLTACSDAHIALRMAGGEFCGNAAMCAAVLYAEQTGLHAGLITVCVSGAEKPVTVEVLPHTDAGRRARVTMPRPLSIGTETLPGSLTLPVVRFPGICHVICEGEKAPARKEAEALAPVWCRALDAEALGIMLLDTEAARLTPLVYVPAAGTLVWERSCASGTAAVGAFLAEQAGGEVTAALTQPGGVLTIRARPGGDLLLSGSVKFSPPREI